MLADQLAAAVTAQLAELGTTAVVDVVELRDYAGDIANNLVTGYAGPALAAVIAKVEDADAMIAVTPVFSASYSGLFKSFFDILDPKLLDGMPVLFGATGGSSRHSLVLDMAIRPLFSYLRARTMPTAVYASPEDWGQGGGGADGLDRRIAQGAGELAVALAPTGGTRSQGNAAGGSIGSSQPALDHKAKRAAREAEKMESLPFEQLLAQITAR
ncbi:CE1759 family FMN reductase [Arthrobacter sp. 35W]|uniref:CE1759 family FMN reductase n=1 Tax=Arthrobacter sp. 35W TaxID=1132441 RepID=UPI00040AE176|nr:CE1759 family FMN reductase [Arthrobacter sp. 35W]